MNNLRLNENQEIKDATRPKSPGSLAKIVSRVKNMRGALLVAVAPLVVLGGYACGSAFEASGDGGSDAGETGDAGTDAPVDGSNPDGCVPTDEICDGKDNDCNLKIDDHPVLQTTCLNVGVCEGAQDAVECVNGQETECSYLSKKEFELEFERTCDGLDNNCNGTVDENCVKIEATTCNKVGVRLNESSITFLPVSSDDNKDCGTVAVTFMSEPGYALYLWERDIHKFTMTTDAQYECDTNCSWYLSSPNYTEIFHDIEVKLPTMIPAEETAVGLNKVEYGTTLPCATDMFTCTHILPAE